MMYKDDLRPKWPKNYSFLLKEKKLIEIKMREEEKSGDSSLTLFL